MIKHWTTRIAAIGASVVLTMRIFSEPPQGRLRGNHVIERVIDDVAYSGYDPKEVVNNRVVITLPMDRHATPPRSGTIFGLN
jgi:hypothetical protein